MSTSLQQSYGNHPRGECEPARPRGVVGRAMELELIPRLLAHTRGALPGTDPDATPVIKLEDGDVDALVQACLSHDEERCPAIVSQLLEAGVPLERICLDLLAPAARALGSMWEEDQVDFLEVTLGLGRMQRVVRDIGRRVSAQTPMSSDAGQAFLCAMPDEQHSLGLAMVAEFFVADGWGVTVGHPLGNSDVVHEVGAHWYDVVGLSAGLTERIPKIADLIAAVRAGSLNADLAIMVGGRAFLHDPSLVDRVGADASAPDAAQGPLVARTLVQTRRTALDDQTPPSASLSP